MVHGGELGVLTTEPCPAAASAGPEARLSQSAVVPGPRRPARARLLDTKTTVNGLPAHILLVQAIVVLLPLAALLLVLSALWPAARAKLAGPNAILAILVVILVPITTDAGGWLERRVASTPAVRTHAELGDTALWVAIPVAALALLVWWRRRESLASQTAGTDSGAVATRRHTFLAPASTAVTVVLSVLAAGAAFYDIYRIGDSGAQASWQGQFSVTPAPALPAPDAWLGRPDREAPHPGDVSAGLSKLASTGPRAGSRLARAVDDHRQSTRVAHPTMPSGRKRFAFYGRTSTTRYQDCVSSRGWQQYMGRTPRHRSEPDHHCLLRRRHLTPHSLATETPGPPTCCPRSPARTRKDATVVGLEHRRAHCLTARGQPNTEWAPGSSQGPSPSRGSRAHQPQVPRTVRVCGQPRPRLVPHSLPCDLRQPWAFLPCVRRCGAH